MAKTKTKKPAAKAAAVKSKTIRKAAPKAATKAKSAPRRKVAKTKKR